MKSSKVNWKIKEDRNRYRREWYAKNKKSVQSETPTNGDQTLTPWKKRQMQKKASQVRPLKLCGCPECGVEFGIRKDGQYQDIKLDNCPVCSRRFYQAGGQS